MSDEIAINMEYDEAVPAGMGMGEIDPNGFFAKGFAPGVTSCSHLYQPSGYIPILLVNRQDIHRHTNHGACADFRFHVGTAREHVFLTRLFLYGF